MSKFTNPETQANMYCGFYPSNKGDRKYGASDFGKFLDGLICDGVFTTMYNQFKVSAVEPASRTVVVDTGKAWFNDTWIVLAEEYAIECEAAYDDGDRYDAVVLANNTTFSDYTHDGQTVSARDASVFVIKGEKSAAGNPTFPIEAGDQEVSDGVYLYPIANIYRGKGTSTITTADVKPCVGTEVCPWVTALVTPNKEATAFTEYWQAQLDKFINGLQADWDAEKAVYNDDWNAYFNVKKSETDTWLANEQASIDAWFETIKGKLSEDQATSLQMQIDENELREILTHGFKCGSTTELLDDGSVRSTCNRASDPLHGYIRTTSFYNEEDGSSRVLTQLYDSNDNLIAASVSLIYSNGYIEKTVDLLW